MELIDKGEGLMRYELGEGSQLPPEREERRRLGSYRNKPAMASWEKPRVHHAYSEIKASVKRARRPAVSGAMLYVTARLNPCGLDLRPGLPGLGEK
jgi:hypothetical protein